MVVVDGQADNRACNRIVVVFRAIIIIGLRHLTLSNRPVHNAPTLLYMLQKSQIFIQVNRPWLVARESMKIDTMSNGMEFFSETLFLSAMRLTIFLACRKYLLRSLYSDLQSLSSTSAALLTPNSPPSTPTTSNGTFELDSLPAPNLQTPKSSSSSLSRHSPDTAFLHSAVSRGLFSWTLAECCTMFVLLMMQGAGIFAARTRLLNFRFSLSFLLSAILVLIPLSVSLLAALGSPSPVSAATGSSTTSQRRRTLKRLLGPRALLSLVTIGLYLFLLSYIPLPPALVSSASNSSSSSSETGLTLTAAALARLIVLGTIILGLLSGFGAISGSWRFLPWLERTKAVPSDRDVDAAAYALSSIQNDLRDRSEEARRRQGVAQDSSWLARVGSTFRGGDSLSQELSGLKALEHQMSLNLESLRQRRAAALFSHTFKGRIYAIAGRAFAVYCVIRVFSARSQASYPDLIAQLLKTLLSISPVSPELKNIKHEQIESFARQISLVLVGVIILSSLRMVLRGVTRGIYLLSTIVQLRSSFPPSSPSPTAPIDVDADEGSTNLFTTIPEYQVFGSLFDWSFLIAASVSAFVRWGAERVNG
ncbi:hypothetical protein BDQ12DRAFT_756357 [Crucibulum laeve]|uniref:Abscisic acid G-protein coupled receptor-domain-containing protein n=1 Tax=Crucibulum laeve TaxID=68775 RepID=A0A5C3LSF3_9AGAR|nr:hypothetical protein BDQ12DRAFT_756357 [Crucibulum laeve]